ncbi:MAG TPA: DNA primase [Clostridiales bacterium]|nr:DNA primase [Clostridiales bacterium]
MYNYFNDEFIEEIRVNNDIVDVVSEYVHLEKKGRYYFGLCPFHNEKTPSFSVTPALQIFNCFGCNKGGNVIHFIMNIENLDFAEAVKFLADRAGIRLPDEKNVNDEEYKLKKDILDINRTVAHYFYDNLMSSRGVKGQEYLRNRGIHPATLRKFGLGYSLPEGNNIFGLFVDKGFSYKAIISSGLVIKSKSGEYFDRFKNRLMFPIFDVRGNVIGFGGRTLDGSLPKYINSPETLVYNKGKHLYALNFAKSIRKKNLIVVEGYMDVITLHQNGIINSVAPLGTALTENQGRLLKKYAEEVIISFDADTAGQAAAIRGLDLLAGIGCTVKVLSIPDGKDPDDFVRKNGADEFRKLIDGSRNLVEYKIGCLKNRIDTSTTEGKLKFVKKAAEIISRLDSRVDVEVYVKKFSEQYGISVEAFYSEVLRSVQPGKNIKEVKFYNEKKHNDVNAASGKKVGNIDLKANYSELLLFAILCIDNNAYKLIKDKIGVADFSAENKPIAEIVFNRLQSNYGIVSAELLNIMEAEKAGEFARILEQECNFDDSRKAAIDVVNKIFITKLENRKREILEMLKNKENMQNLQTSELLKELNELVVVIKKHSEY